MDAGTQSASLSQAGCRLGTLTRLRVFWRSLFLQAAWNPRGMQNLGFAWALLPALKELYPDPDQRRAALSRHLGFFNCHPYTAAAILGGTLFHERRIASGMEAPAAVEGFKKSLMGPLAALGDGFFWLSLRPAAGALSALLALLTGFWGVALFVLSYNAVHLALRLRFFASGCRLGDGVVASLATVRLTSYAEPLRALATAGAGASLAVLGAGDAGRPELRPLLLALGLGLAGWALLGRGLSPYALAGAAAAAAVVGSIL